jgi:Ca2+-binding RTX toxin-like protein
MRDISNFPGQTFQSEIQGGNFNFFKNNLVSTFGGAIPPGTDDPVMSVGGTAYWEGVVFNYYDAESAADGLVSNTGWNRKLVLLGSNMEFDSAGVPTSGDIEAIVIMNVHEQVLVGADQFEDVSAADFYQAWTSTSTADDTDFINSLFDVETGGNVIEGSRFAENHLGDAEDNVINGNGGNDTISGGAGNDSLNGGSGRDKLRGEGGRDDLQGGGDKDKLWGGAGGDNLGGGGGNDKLWGNGGSDTLDGGAGNDVLIGGKGGDVFIFGAGADSIRDFNTGQAGELIDLNNAGGIDSFDDLITNHAADTNDGVLITVSNNSLLLEGITIADLQADDFLF